MKRSLFSTLLLAAIAPAGTTTYAFENQTQELVYVEQEELYVFPVAPSTVTHEAVEGPVAGFAFDGTFVPFGVVRQVTLDSGATVTVDTTLAETEGLIVIIDTLEGD